MRPTSMDSSDSTHGILDNMESDNTVHLVDSLARSHCLDLDLPDDITGLRLKNTTIAKDKTASSDADMCDIYSYGIDDQSFKKVTDNQYRGPKTGIPDPRYYPKIANQNGCKQVAIASVRPREDMSIKPFHAPPKTKAPLEEPFLPDPQQHPIPDAVCFRRDFVKRARICILHECYILEQAARKVLESFYKSSAQDSPMLIPIRITNTARISPYLIHPDVKLMLLRDADVVATTIATSFSLKQLQQPQETYEHLFLKMREYFNNWALSMASNATELGPLTETVAIVTVARWTWFLEVLVRQTLGLCLGEDLCAGLAPVRAPQQEDEPPELVTCIIKIICQKTRKIARYLVDRIVQCGIYKRISAERLVQGILKHLISVAINICREAIGGGLTSDPSPSLKRWADKSLERWTNESLDMGVRGPLWNAVMESRARDITVSLGTNCPVDAVQQDFNPLLDRLLLWEYRYGMKSAFASAKNELRKCSLAKRHSSDQITGTIVPLCLPFRSLWSNVAPGCCTTVYLAVFVQPDCIMTHISVTSMMAEEVLKDDCSGVVEIPLPLSTRKTVDLLPGFSSHDIVLQEPENLYLQANLAGTALCQEKGTVQLMITWSFNIYQSGFGEPVHTSLGRLQYNIKVVGKLFQFRCQMDGVN